MQGPLTMISRFDVPDHGLPTFCYVNVLDTDILIAAVT
jgi:hypothetical protein